MKKETKQRIVDNLEIALAMIVSGILVYGMETCKRQHSENEQNNLQNKEVVAKKAQSDSVAAKTRVLMIQNLKTR